VGGERGRVERERERGQRERLVRESHKRIEGKGKREAHLSLSVCVCAAYVKTAAKGSKIMEMLFGTILQQIVLCCCKCML